MYHPIEGNNFNELALNAYHDLLNEGRRQASRNGDILCINNAVLNLYKPQNRHLYLAGRKSNPIAQIAETFWVMAGMDDIDPYLSFFLPRAKDYSDDGKTWRGAYGPRLYLYEQLQEAAAVFVTDGITTRQSVVQILLPELDASGCLRNAVTNEPIDKTKDRPCNNELVFFCTPNEDGSWSLNMNVFQRSGDAIWGALNINVFEWTFLQELMVNNVNNLVDENVVLGEYTHFVSNLHIYDFTAQQARDALKLESESIGWPDNYGQLIATGSVERDQEFFEDLVEMLSEFITTDIGQDSDDDTIVNWWYSCLVELFNRYDIPECPDNLLWQYVGHVMLHIAHKRGLELGHPEFIVTDTNKDFINCLSHSPLVKHI